MKEKASAMKKEIHAIAGYKALTVSKYYISTLLGITSILLGLLRLPMSSFYILIVMLILPPILEHILAEAKTGNSRLLKSAAAEPDFLLKNLKAKYKYQKSKSIANSATYLLAGLFILLWQYNYNQMVIIHDFLLYVPTFILTTGIFLRFLLIIIYRIKLPYDLNHNIG